MFENLDKIMKFCGGGGLKIDPIKKYRKLKFSYNHY